MRKGKMRTQGGFTLIEVLVALAILTIAMLGVGATNALQSGGIAGAIPTGQAAVTRGYYQSTATLCAQNRLEQVKRVQYRVGAADPFAPGNPPPGFADEPQPGQASPIDCPPNSTRQVRVVDDPSGTKRVTVTVAFTLPTDRGANQEGVRLSTLVAARP
jgi:prepilin-type N-terminal cleavage/methylation domain-containing protein